jgi:Ca2+-binding RTX toxin-like protein
LNGGAGNDTLRGGPGSDFAADGADLFVFAARPGAANADTIEGFDFSDGADNLAFVRSWHPDIGATGAFAPNDARFWAAPGAISGHDLSDRVILDTSTGNLYYDADGSGSGASQLVASFVGIPDLQANDIIVI